MSFDPQATDAPTHQATLNAEREATDRLVILVWAGFFFALALFSLLPGLDLLVSAHYFSAEQGFFRRNDPVVLWLYDWTPWIGRALVLALALFALLAPLLARHAASQGHTERATRLRGPWRRTATLAVAVALLGNGLLIEGVFKNTVGRPRPVQTVQFGGPDSYVAPLRLGPEPATHKSWVSSHAAAGFALMGLGLGCGPVWRRRWILIAMVSGGVIGLGRIMQGGHFASDVVFSFYSLWLASELVRWIDRRRQPPAPRRHHRHTTH